MFDSLKYAKILEEVGTPRTHAETHIRVLSDVVGEEMVTKDDLARGLKETKKDLVFLISDVRSEIKGEINDLRSEVKAEFDLFRTEVKAEFDSFRAEVKSEINELRTELHSEIRGVRSDMEKLENRMVIKMGVMMASFMTLGLAVSQTLLS